MKRFIKILVSGLITTSMLIGSVSSVFAGQVVKVSIGSTSASINDYNTTLSIAPYIQQPSESMMIPLRFVSTGLGIDESDIQYNPNTKEITITYNGTTAKFIVGTDKLILNGEEFSMLIENQYPVYTEIKNGTTFIPLRSLELAFNNIKIDWVNDTKTAILTNQTEDNTTDNLQVEQPIVEDNSSLTDNTQPVEDIAVPLEETLTEENIIKMENEMIKLVNQEREKLGLNKLEISKKLMQTAKEKSKDMATNNYFSHTNPDGYTMAIDLGFSENIGQQLLPINQFDSFKASLDGHYENMINPHHKYIGVGFTFELDYENLTYDGKPSVKTYWTQQFSSNDKWAN